MEQENAFGWRWGNRIYRDHEGDVEWLMRDALRRAVDIRDEEVTPRAVMLVDVLNRLKDAVGIPSEATGIEWLWSNTD